MQHIMEIKRCTKCGELKSASDFRKDSSKKDGLHSHCKQCKRDADKLYKDNHIESCRAKDKEYYQKNSDKIKARVKLWCENNPEQKIEQRRRWYENEQVLECCSWKNLRPLEKISNIKKGGKVDHEVIHAHQMKVLEFMNLQGVPDCSGDIAVASKPPIR